MDAVGDFFSSVGCAIQSVLPGLPAGGSLSDIFGPGVPIAAAGTSAILYGAKYSTVAAAVGAGFPLAVVGTGIAIVGAASIVDSFF